MKNYFLIIPAYIACSFIFSGCGPIAKTEIPATATNTLILPTITNTETRIFPTATNTETRISPTATSPATNTPSPTPSPAPAIIRDISVGWWTTCVVINSGTVECWGTVPIDPQRGVVDNLFNKPVPVNQNVDSVKILTTGVNHNCYVRFGGEVDCWGNNYNGSLGIDGVDKSYLPLMVPGLEKGVRQLVNFGDVNCALTQTSTVECWPAYHFTSVNVNGPVLIEQFGKDVKAIGLGEDSMGRYDGTPYLCAIVKTGSINCIDYLNKSFHTIGGIDQDVVDLSVGEHFGCALLINTRIKCWGWNKQGQLGNGTYTDSAGAVDVTGVDGAVKLLTVGYDDACVVTNHNSVYCWGDNSFGQLGGRGQEKQQRSGIHYQRNG
jgi:alpha-tubulin suppressor-like RCC1 family protein